jgi:CheY-like chemotaxis protein
MQAPARRNDWPTQALMAKLLIVDDDLDVRETLAEFLSAHGYDIRTARHGEEGLRALASELPDVLLLDVEMPVMDGRAMAYRMQLHDAGLEHVPVVLFSGGVELPRVAREIRTPYYLVKPVDPAALLRTLERAGTSRRAPPVREDATRTAGPRREAQVPLEVAAMPLTSLADYVAGMHGPSEELR